MTSERTASAAAARRASPSGDSRTAPTRSATRADAVRAAADSVSSCVSTHRTTSREAFFALVEEARRQDLDVGGHVPLQVTWEEAAAAGMRSFEHVQTLAENEVTAGANRAATAEEAVQRLKKSEPTSGAQPEPTSPAS